MGQGLTLIFLMVGMYLVFMPLDLLLLGLLMRLKLARSIRYVEIYRDGIRLCQLAQLL